MGTEGTQNVRLLFDRTCCFAQSAENPEDRGKIISEVLWLVSPQAQSLDLIHLCLRLHSSMVQITVTFVRLALRSITTVVQLT